jgi:Bacterial Ig-like domain (group 2).
MPELFKIRTNAQRKISDKRRVENIMKIKQIRVIGCLLVVFMAVSVIPMMTACGAKTTTPVLTSIGVTITHSTVPILTMHSTMQLDATGNYSSGLTPDLTNDVIWDSSNPSVAICKTGVVTGLADGTTDITATLNGITSQSLTITVISLSSIVVAPAVPVALAVGATQQFMVTGINWDGSTADISSQVTWASDTPAAATISSTGLAAAMAVGTANITASMSGITSRPITINVVAAASAATNH